MEIIFGFVFELLAEFVISLVGEGLAEVGLHSLSKRSGGKVWSRTITIFLYGILGTALGAISLWFLPLMVFGNRSVPIIFFIVSPILAGLGLCFANWIIKRGIDDQPFFRISKFISGALFAFMFSLTRTIFG